MSHSRWRHKQPTQASHTDDWLMTYADMITLLLCFFVVFLIVSISKKEPPPKTPAQQMVTHTEQPGPPDQQPDIAAQSKYHDPFQGNLPFHDIDAEQPDPPAPAVEDKSTEPAPTLPQLVDNLKAQGANVEQQGDRITTLEMSSGAFFDVGSATINTAGKPILENVAANLKADQYKDYQITVEGHTDDSPISTAQFPSNWELSTARASAVVHFFLQQGIPAQRLRAAGYADTFPKAPNRDANGNAIPANQAENRRVVIKLEKIEKSAQ